MQHTMRMNQSVFFALAAAVLFGASTPLAKLLVSDVSPVLLGGLLYLGSGVGLSLFRMVRDKGWAPSQIQRGEWPWLLGAILFGGILGPVALMFGLTRVSGSATSLMLNLESVLTAVLAGIVNCTIAMTWGADLPGLQTTLQAMTVGLLGYGLSLVFFVLALRGLGAARTGAYFSTAPFVGSAISLLLLGETAGAAFWMAGALMAIGVCLHLTESHDHGHAHEPLAHAHAHTHDEHHQHPHDVCVGMTEPHVHWHRHAAITHKHPHYPDIHHQHSH